MTLTLGYLELLGAVEVVMAIYGLSNNIDMTTDILFHLWFFITGFTCVNNMCGSYV